jgi:predicted RNase H-like HicB family nuclease
MQIESKIIVWFSLEDYAFIAEAPGHPALVAQGQTEDEAVGNLKKILNDQQETSPPNDV